MRLILPWLALFFLLLPATTSPAPSPPPPSPAAATACPLNMSFIATFPWDSSCCQSSQIQSNLSCCCTGILGLLGSSLALRLNTTSLFGVPDLATSLSCLDNLQSLLASSFSLPSSAVASCNISRYVPTDNHTCAGIRTLPDWRRKLGNTTVLDEPCRSVNADDSSCNACIGKLMTVASTLLGLDSDVSQTHNEECVFFTRLYAAGAASALAPTDTNNARCIFLLKFLASSQDSGGSSSRVQLIAGLSAAVAVLALSLLALGVFLRVTRERRRKMVEQGGWRPTGGATWYSFEELRKATGDFGDDSVIGQGGFAVVYKAELPEGGTVAVKRMHWSGDTRQDEEFANEVEIISNLRHRNLVSLRGCCIAGEAGASAGAGKQWYLVYDYMPNGSLYDHLFRPRAAGMRPLTWAQRRSIILDTARGLAYLHHGVKPAIIHRDIKPQNILLDAEMRAAVADFGLAKQREYGTHTYHVTRRVAGTRGYLAPEYALYGHLSGKVDVYSFGVMVLEIMSGRRAVDSSSAVAEEPVVVAEWARAMMTAGRAADVVDPAMIDGEDEAALAEMERFVRVASLCAHLRVGVRPTMAEALKMLEGDVEVVAVPTLTWSEDSDKVFV